MVAAEEHHDARPGRDGSASGTADSDDVLDAVWGVLEAVPDPEIPVLSIVDLGIVRFVRWNSVGVLQVGVTPTYSGCPATEVIRRSVREALDEAGFKGAVIEEVLSPAWTSDWLSESGRRKLAQFGIAPPTRAVSAPHHLFGGAPAVACPRCGSINTRRVSEFGSTPCKAHFCCGECLEPFDHFKCI